MTATSPGATPSARIRSTSAAQSAASPSFSRLSLPGGVASSKPRPEVSITSSGATASGGPSSSAVATAGWAVSAPP